VAQVVLVDDQQTVQELPAEGADHPFADGVRSRRPRQAGENPDAVCQEYGVQGVGALTCTVPDQESDWRGALLEIHQEVAGRLRCPRAVGVLGDAAQVNPAGAVLNDDQDIDAPQQHGVHVDEIGGKAVSAHGT
jgi:hypothetical protein